LIRTKLSIGIVVLLLATGCSRLFEKRQVRNDFLKDHPDYTVVSIGDADGNTTTVVTFFIVYKKPSSGQEYWADYAYDTKDGKLELVGKGHESIYTSIKAVRR
jgi:hypothetical protein